MSSIFDKPCYLSQVRLSVTIMPFARTSTWEKHDNKQGTPRFSMVVWHHELCVTFRHLRKPITGKPNRQSDYNVYTLKPFTAPSARIVGDFPYSQWRKWCLIVAYDRVFYTSPIPILLNIPARLFASSNDEASQILRHETSALRQHLQAQIYKYLRIPRTLLDATACYKTVPSLENFKISDLAWL